MTWGWIFEVLPFGTRQPPPGGLGSLSVVRQFAVPSIAAQQTWRPCCFAAATAMAVAIEHLRKPSVVSKITPPRFPAAAALRPLVGATPPPPPSPPPPRAYPGRKAEEATTSE